MPGTYERGGSEATTLPRVPRRRGGVGGLRGLVASASLFCRDTTLHGIKQVYLAANWFKRVLWLSLILVSLSFMVILLSIKMSTYSQTPVQLDLQVNYMPSMDFPAIIICNANLFRISEATAEGMYDVITDVYNDSTAHKISPEAHPNLKEVNGYEFVQRSAHQLDDMLIYCRWPNGSVCDQRDFRKVNTDYGVCYGINTEAGEGAAKVDNPGFGYGLYLILNTEDYEAMPGRQRTIGIKVLIYNQSDVPLVAEHGFDVAPGFQTSVGLKYSESIKLPRQDGGDCYAVALDFFPKVAYNRKLCVVNEKYARAANVCDCLSYNMPAPPAVARRFQQCSAVEYFSCMTTEIQHSVLVNDSICPQHCDDFEYQQYISFSKLSPTRVNNILEDSQKSGRLGVSNKREQIQRRYMAAMEARSRFTKDLRAKDAAVVDRLLFVHDEIFNQSLTPGIDVAAAVNGRLHNVSCYDASLDSLLGNSSFCSVEALDEALLRPGSVFRELSQLLREPSPVGPALSSLSDALNSSAASLVFLAEEVGNRSAEWDAGPPAPSSGGREQVLFWVQEELFLESARGRLSPALRSLQEEVGRFPALEELLYDFLGVSENVTSIHQEEGFLALRFRAREARSCLESSLGAELAVVAGEELTKATIPLILPQTRQIVATARDCIGRLDALAEDWDAYESRVQQFEKNFTRLVDSLKETCGLFQGLIDLHKSWQSFEEARAKTSTTTGTTEATTTTARHGDVEYEEVYQQLLAFRDVVTSKAEFAENILTLAAHQFPASVKRHFQALQDEAAALTKVCDDADTALTQVLGSFNDSRYRDLLVLFFPDASADQMSQLPWKLRAVNACVPLLRDEMQDVQALAASLQDQYVKRFDALRDYLRAYNLSLQLTPEFYKNNLLSVNIYVREMAIELLRQKSSYTVYSLVSDIGGVLGLFLGASVLTVAEMIDFGVGQILLFLGLRTPLTASSPRLPSLRSKAESRRSGKAGAKSPALTESSQTLLTDTLPRHVRAQPILQPLIRPAPASDEPLYEAPFRLSGKPPEGRSVRVGVVPPRWEPPRGVVGLPLGAALAPLVPTYGSPQRRLGPPKLGPQPPSGPPPTGPSQAMGSTARKAGQSPVSQGHPAPPPLSIFRTGSATGRTIL